MVVQSFVDQGALPRNVIALVERPADAITDDTSGTAKSWTLAEVERFRDSVRQDRLFACWLLSSTDFAVLKCSASGGQHSTVTRCRFVAAA
jgi:hypothetical protein